MNQINQPFKIRCSAISKIMGNRETITVKKLDRLDYLEKRKSDSEKGVLDNKGKAIKALTENMEAERLDLIAKRDSKPELSAGAKTYVKNWVKEKVYGNKKTFSSKYTEKGIITENECVDLISKVLNIRFLKKNTKRKSNEYLTGECDSLLKDYVLDYKSSWDCFSFPIFQNGIAKKEYRDQGQGYMELEQKPKFLLCYCLIDMPDYMIEKMARNQFWQATEKRSESEIYEELKELHTYSHLPDHLRVKVFEYSYDKAFINDLYDTVDMCRIYEKQLLNKLEFSETELNKYAFAA